MRWPSPFRDRPKGVELQLTPMIDCVFLLMIYFLWSSSFAVAEKLMPSALSAARGSGPGAPSVPPPEADFEDLVVRIRWTASGPAWEVNGAPSPSLGELRVLLTTLARIKRDAPVILHPDPDVSLGDVIDVLDASRLAGFEKVQFAASERVEGRE
jgi:biopolymer transport protein ExbD